MQLVACGQPAGFVALAGDSDDDIPLVWSAPDEVTNLLVNTIGGGEATWNDQRPLVGPETSYDLVSGPISTSGGVDFPSAVCLHSGGESIFNETRPAPPVGTAFWYLARGRNSCAVGTYGTSQRDAFISACP